MKTNTEKTEITPEIVSNLLPFSTAKTTARGNGEILVDDRHGSRICVTGACRTGYERAQIARYIVRAVNAFPKLVEALEAVSRLACLEEYRSIHGMVESALALAREGSSRGCWQGRGNL